VGGWEKCKIGENKGVEKQYSSEKSNRVAKKRQVHPEHLQQSDYKENIKFQYQ
jgi:hypothetical protein